MPPLGHDYTLSQHCTVRVDSGRRLFALPSVLSPACASCENRQASQRVVLNARDPSAALSRAQEGRLKPRIESSALLNWLGDAGMPGCQVGRPVENYTQVPVYRFDRAPGGRRALHIPKPGPAHVIRVGDSASAAVADDCPALASVSARCVQALRPPPRAGLIRPMPAAAATPFVVFPGARALAARHAWRAARSAPGSADPRSAACAARSWERAPGAAG
jgi:hypothetical protein